MTTDVRPLGTEVARVRDGGRPKRLDPIETVFQVALMTLKRSVRGARLLWVLGIVAFPAALSLLVGGLSEEPRKEAIFFLNAISNVHFVIVVPAVALALATSFPWPEAEEGTLTYWFTSPVPRWSILLGRFAAGLVVGVVVLPLSVVAITLPLEAPEGMDLWSTARAAIAATWLGFPAYLGIFTLVSTGLRRGLVLGVIFILVENSLAIFRGVGIQSLTIVHYLRAYLAPTAPKDLKKPALKAFFLDPETMPSSLSVVIVCVSVLLVTLGLSLLAVHLVEYRSKQAQSA